MKFKPPGRFMKHTSIIIVLIATAFVTGCATRAKTDKLTPHAVKLERKHPGTVQVKVTGDAKLQKDWLLNADYQKALTDAIGESALFSRVMKEAGDYRLEVTIADLSLPSMGFNMTASVTSHWKLFRVSNGEEVFRTSVLSTHTATLGEAFAGTTRLRKAVEGAGLENIRDGLMKLSHLELP